MATLKKLRDNVRQSYVEQIFEMLSKSEDVMMVKSNEMVFPVTDVEGGEHFVKIAISVPTGGRDEAEYDGDGEAESYKIKLAEAKAKAEKKAKEKAEKIERDRIRREEARLKKEAAKAKK